MDATGCRSVIAKDIIEARADCVPTVKDNQKELEQRIEDASRFQERAENPDFGHGRIENRTCRIPTNLAYIDTAKWEKAQALVKIVSERYNKTLHKQEETYVRDYISSLTEDFSRPVRSHWGIEIRLHRQLDVYFGEDASG
jgi:predicted transposase YbfD/YdcC